MALSEGLITSAAEGEILESLSNIDVEVNYINIAEDTIDALIAAASLDCNLYLGHGGCFPVIEKLSKQWLIGNISPVADWFHNLHTTLGLKTKKSMYEYFSEKSGEHFDTVKQRLIRLQKGKYLPSSQELNDLFLLISRAPEEYMALHLMHGIRRATMLVGQILESDEKRPEIHKSHGCYREMASEIVKPFASIRISKSLSIFVIKQTDGKFRWTRVNHICSTFITSWFALNYVNRTTPCIIQFCNENLIIQASCFHVVK